MTQNIFLPSSKHSMEQPLGDINIVCVHVSASPKNEEKKNDKRKWQVTNSPHVFTAKEQSRRLVVSLTVCSVHCAYNICIYLYAGNSGYNTYKNVQLCICIYFLVFSLLSCTSSGATLRQPHFFLSSRVFIFSTYFWNKNVNFNIF